LQRQDFPRTVDDNLGFKSKQYNGSTDRTLELDPFGDDVGVDNPYDGGDGLGDYPSHGDLADFDSGCTLDGGPLPAKLWVNGLAEIAPTSAETLCKGLSANAVHLSYQSNNRCQYRESGT
jgi:hypothetical protein